MFVALIENFFVYVRRALLIAAFLVTASAQMDSNQPGYDYCFDANNPQSILIAKQAFEYTELANAEIFVKSSFVDTASKSAEWIYETKSIHESSPIVQTSDNCLRQANIRSE